MKHKYKHHKSVVKEIFRRSFLRARRIVFVTKVITNTQAQAV